MIFHKLAKIKVKNKYYILIYEKNELRKKYQRM